MRVGAIALRHGRTDSLGLCQIGLARKVIMASRPESPTQAGMNVDRQYVGIFFAQPLGWSRRWRAKHHLKPCRAQNIDGAIHPFPRELALAFFNAAPGELTNAHIGQAKFTHPLRIAGPHLFGPMFRIIAYAKHGYIVTGRSVKSKVFMAAGYQRQW